MRHNVVSVLLEGVYWTKYSKKKLHTLQHSYQLEVGRKTNPNGNLGQRAYKSSQISRILGRDFPNFHSLVVTCRQLSKRVNTRCSTSTTKRQWRWYRWDSYKWQWTTYKNTMNQIDELNCRLWYWNGIQSPVRCKHIVVSIKSWRATKCNTFAHFFDRN